MNHLHSPYLLVVEDSDEDFEALQRVLSRSCTDFHIDVKRCSCGDDALELMRKESTSSKNAHLPSLVLLDLNLPGTDGREVLIEIKQDEVLKSIPVVILTTSSNPKDIQSCYRYGANSYLIKPMDVQQLKTTVCSTMDYWLKIVALPG
ncbi:MAG: response regulator [Cyanobacteria bacterium J06627_28]